MKLALGTVQFGLAYGIANESGQVPRGEVTRILIRASEAGIDTLDTAAAYGEAETVLGSVGIADWRIVTKVPAIPTGTEDARAWVRSVATRSLENLGSDHVDAILLHRAQDLLGLDGVELWAGLRDIQDAGLCTRIGVSIYRPDILDHLSGDIRPDLVQAPFNVLDREIELSGWADRLAGAGTAIHIRSVFLQGLLLMHHYVRAARFQADFPQLAAWDDFLAHTGRDAVSTALGFALSRPWAERVVVGVNDVWQLGEILDAAAQPPVDLPESLASRDPKLIDPSQWSKA